MKTNDQIILEAMASRIRELEGEVDALNLDLDDIGKQYNDLELDMSDKHYFMSSYVLSYCDLDALFEHVKIYINENGKSVIRNCEMYIDAIWSDAETNEKQEKLVAILMYLNEMKRDNEK